MAFIGRASVRLQHNRFVFTQLREVRLGHRCGRFWGGHHQLGCEEVDLLGLVICRMVCSSFHFQNGKRFPRARWPSQAPRSPENSDSVAGGCGETEKWTKLILQPLAKVGCESNLGHPEGGQ